MNFPFYKTKRLRLIHWVYWVLLAYTVAALVWWFIALNKQNRQMVQYEMAQLKKDSPDYWNAVQQLSAIEKRKTAQYIGEGSTFLLLILAGAAFIYYQARQQLKSNRQLQHFMMAITHELKTPIAVTKLNLETLQKHQLPEAQQQKLLQNTVQETNRLDALCNNMLLASQLDAGDYFITKESISFSALVQAGVQEFSSRFPQRTVSSAIEPDIYLSGDQLLLQMAINNLIDNAIKYSPKDAAVEVHLFKQNGAICFSVKDAGKGILAEEKQKVFDKYYRIGNAATKGAKGTGLGLYLTKKIAQQHNATISLTDNQPVGSNFTIIFSA